LINGGTAGMIWLFLVAWIGFLAVNTSMAEMASMYDGPGRASVHVLMVY
jgi:amino acid transporter